MKRVITLFLVPFVIFAVLTTPGSADTVFSLVNGSYDSSRIESFSTIWSVFWTNMRIDFTQTGEFTYSGFGEATVTETTNNGMSQRNINGYLQIEYDAQTGLMQGDYQIIDTTEIVPINKYQVNVNGTIIHTYTGTLEAEVDPSSEKITLDLGGSFEQVIEGTPYGSTPEPGSNGLIASWGFDIPFDVQGTIPGQSCAPQVMGLDGLMPGDTLAPSASYFAPDGSEVDTLNENWEINGVQTDSITWQGEAVTINLQWTCPDSKTFSKTFTIAAYQGPGLETGVPQTTTPAQPLEGGQDTPSNGISPLGIGILAAGAAAVLGSAGLLIHTLIKTPAIMQPGSSTPVSTPPTPTIPPASGLTPTATNAPPSSVQPSSSVSTTSTPPPLSSQPAFSTTTMPPPMSMQPSSPQQPSQDIQLPKGRLTPQEITRLTNLRNEMSNEMERIKNQWRQTRDAVEKLKTLKKKNMIKFLMKQGLEVQNWIMDSPVEVINKFTIDPVMEKAFQKHDTSQDGNIIVSIHNRIQQLESEMQQMVKDVKYLSKEINKINHKLGK